GEGSRPSSAAGAAAVADQRITSSSTKFGCAPAGPCVSSRALVGQIFEVQQPADFLDAVKHSHAHRGGRETHFRRQIGVRQTVEEMEPDDLAAAVVELP